MKEGVQEKKTLLVISDDQHFHREVSAMAHRSDLPSKVTLVPTSYSESQQQKTPANWILIDISEGELRRVEFARNLCISAAASGTKVICAGSNLNVDHILYLLKMGVHHFLKTPFDPHEFKSLFFSLLTETHLPEELSSKPRSGKIITVYSLKGGSGVSLLAINLAIALIKREKKPRVAICDLASQTGDVTTYLNLNAKYTLRDLIDNVDRLDTSLLEGVMASHESGIHVLASPALDQEALSTHCVEEWQHILHFLKQNHDFTVIDSAHTDPLLLQTTLSLSDAIVLIGNLDVPSLKGILFGLTKLSRLQIDPKKIKIIINRFNAKNQLDIKEFSRNAQHAIDSKLPNDYSVCIESINTGKPVSLHHSNSELAKKIKELADQLHKDLADPSAKILSPEMAENPPVAQAPKKGLWGLL